MSPAEGRAARSREKAVVVRGGPSRSGRQRAQASFFVCARASGTGFFRRSQPTLQQLDNPGEAAAAASLEARSVAAAATPVELGPD